MNGDTHAGIIEALSDDSPLISTSACWAVMPEPGAVIATRCTMKRGHLGDHVSNGGRVAYRWPNEDAS